MFYFPSGNIDQTMLTDKQMYFDRTFSSDPSENFYGFLDHERSIIVALQLIHAALLQELQDTCAANKSLENIKTHPKLDIFLNIL